MNGKGEALYTGGAMPGSELNWIGAYIAADGGPSSYSAFIGDLFRYMSFLPDPGPAFDIAKFNWDRDYKRFGMMEGLYTGSNPDLRKFKARGGKLLSYQGWADQSVLPLNVIDYYDTVERLMGGRAKTQDFFRLFMIPGMAHCRRGPGADGFDPVEALEAWVEKGTAPAMLMTHKMVKDQPYAGIPRLRFPLKREDYAWTRPDFAYPDVAAFSGRGDWRDAKNWRAKK